MKKTLFLLIFLTFLIVACGETVGEKPKNKGLAGFRVEFVNFDPGSEENRVEIPEEVKINITALGYDNEPLTDYNGKVRVEMLYGDNGAASDKNIVSGYLKNVTVKMKNCLDKDRVVVHEIKRHEGDKTEETTGKMGVSPVVYTNFATIPAIQSAVNDDSGSSPLYGSHFDNRNLTLKASKGKTMVVIAVIEGGFYLQEVDSDNGEAGDYSSIYMYTYSTPYVDDNIEEPMSLQVGTVIESANGSVYEFSGFTEMSFPTFKPKYDENGKIVVDKLLVPKKEKGIKDVTGFLPDPDNKKDHINYEMEKYEASLVTVKNVFVDEFLEDDSSFADYSQFPLTVSAGSDVSPLRTITAQTVYTAPLFDPVKEKEQNQKTETKKCYNFTGILKQHNSAQSTWIIVPRDMDDIEPVECKEK